MVIVVEVLMTSTIANPETVFNHDLRAISNNEAGVIDVDIETIYCPVVLYLPLPVSRRSSPPKSMHSIRQNPKILNSGG